MKKISVPALPLAANVCDQLLREVYRDPFMSVAHVLMNPGAFSLLHQHERMVEVYAITRGCGNLVIGSQSYQVQAGSVISIPAKTPHQFFNTGATSLEHLVLALPPFDPTDVQVLGEQSHWRPVSEPHLLPAVVECFDGAKIIPYDFPSLNLSLAFGWVINDPARHKKPHYHQRTTEFVYVVEGSGVIEVDGEIGQAMAGDWVEISTGSPHAIRNNNDQYLVALCLCSPSFSMDDVHYH